MADNEKFNLSNYFLNTDTASNIDGIIMTNSSDELGNLRYPGQLSTEKAVDYGFQLGMGLNAPMLDVATPLVFTPAVLVVMSVPSMYIDSDGKATTMGVLIKDLIESHAKGVSGLDFGYTLNTTDSQVGHDGQTMAVPTKTTRSTVGPSFQFTELAGNLVFNTFKRWIFDIQHPDTNASMTGLSYNGPYTMSAYAMSMMAIQFDPTMRPDHIIDAAFYTNMFPTATGELGIERQIGTVNPKERSITFTGIVQHNEYTKLCGMAIAEKLALHKHNYNVAPMGRKEIDDSIREQGIYAEAETRTAWLEDRTSGDQDNGASSYDSDIGSSEMSMDDRT